MVLLSSICWSPIWTWNWIWVIF